jgi:asparagine synthetase B (glutamine-hydrolysing)
MSTGIIGNTCEREALKHLNASIKKLYLSDNTVNNKDVEICKNIVVTSLSKEKRILKRGNTVIAFDGYLLNKKKKGKGLLDELINLFNLVGPNFTEDLRGSFQIAIFCDYGTAKQALYIYSDQSASRPIFYSFCDEVLFFGPQIESVAAHIQEKRIDWSSAVQFLIGGYFFSGSTILEQIKILEAGHYLFYKNKKLKIKKYFDYSIKKSSGHFNYAHTKQRLSNALRKAILESWKDANEPAILLSGGVDSRYIFYTIAEAVNDSSKLKTVTWGKSLGFEGSDGYIASIIAKRFGAKHIEIEKKSDRIIKEYQEMFPAHSGMTDNVFYHANELSICKELREKHGILSLFRGEECFGRRRRVYNYQNALELVGMSFPHYVKGIDSWFSKQNKKKIIDSYELRLKNELLKYNKLGSNALKDSLYHNHRLVMALQPTNYFKFHYQEIYSPLLDPDALSIIKQVPDRYRIHKRILRDCFYENFPKEANTPLAKYTNLLDWAKEIRNNGSLYSFIMEKIDSLPIEFNKDYYKSSLKQIVQIGQITKNEASLRNSNWKLKDKLPDKSKQLIMDLWLSRHKKVHLAKSTLVIRAALISRYREILLNDRV